MSDIKLNSSIENTFIEIEKNINNIKEILDNVYNAVLTLDEKKWNTKEKKKIDEQFVPYLQMLSTSYANYLKTILNFTRESVKTYEELNNKQQKEAEMLENLSQGG